MFYTLITICQKYTARDFPGGPVVKTPPSTAGAQVLSLVGELRSLMPCMKGKKSIYLDIVHFNVGKYYQKEPYNDNGVGVGN